VIAALSRRHDGSNAEPFLSIRAEAIRHGYSVLFTPATALVTAPVRGHAEGKLEQRLAQLAKPKLLIMDEFGDLPFEPAAAHLLFQLVSRRYERGSILITSNRAVGDWGAVLGDQVVATAILDRLLHHSHMLTIRGDSYRLREKRRSRRHPHRHPPRRHSSGGWLVSQCRPWMGS
jgi:DNA replication protein DnaC